MNLKEWLGNVAPGTSVNAAALAVGMSQTTLNSQANGSATIKPETVVLLARQYGYNPVAALVELGMLTSDEAAGVSMDDLRAQLARDLETRRIESMSDKELTTEVRRLLVEIDQRLANGGVERPIR